LTGATAFTAYATGLTELTAGAALATSNLEVTSVSVDGAQSGRGFHLSYDSTATGKVTLTMTDATTFGSAKTITDQAGHTMNVTQTISLSDLNNGDSEILNFSDLGVKITLTNTTGGIVTADAAAQDFTAGNKLSIDTAVASGTATLQTGANQGDETEVAFVNTSLAGGTGVVPMDTLAATLNTFASDGGARRDNASSLISALDTALGSISSSRATLGAAQNRLQHTIANLGTTSENLSASNSRIRDVDVATESSNMAKNQVLEQAGVSVLAQANQLPQLALKLLG